MDANYSCANDSDESIDGSTDVSFDDSINDSINDSIDEILNKYATMVYRIAFSRTKSKFDADDILQEVFMKYMKYNIDYKSEEHRKAWLIKTTIHTSKTLLTSAWFKKTVAMPDNLLIEMEEKSEVYYAVLKLPTKYRTVIHLFYYEGLSIREISLLLDMKESTVKSHLHRARKSLKEILKGEDFYV